VAKILVADDNSNVQKTVTLALADLGIEVVAVNNGEAAVRKLADVSPDLVLADIFMPVRNGYEVCEYVKKDARFSRVPVVLLVGAFDPLDEREAQRVGADGILKKPFVPPDPLIAMVKMLLDRSLGERLVGVGAAKPAASMRSSSGNGVTTSEQPPASSTRNTQEFAEEEVPTPIDRVSFGEGAHPIAFSQLLDSPTQEFAAPGTGILDPVENEQILTNSRDASLGNPIFWKTEEPEVPVAEEASEADQDLSSGLPMRAWKPDEEAQARAAEPEPEMVQPVEPFELVREDLDEQSGHASTIVETSTSILQDAASQALLNVEPGKPEDLAANPIEWMASVPPPPVVEAEKQPSEWNAETLPAIEESEQNETDNLILVPEPIVPESPAAVVPDSLAISTPSSFSVPESDEEVTEVQPTTANQVEEIGQSHPVLEPVSQSAEDTAHSIPKEKWADLADSVHMASGDPSAEKQRPANESTLHIPPTQSEEPSAPATNSASSLSKPSGQSAEDTARAIPTRDWADLTASFRSKMNAPAMESPIGTPAPQIPASASAPANTQAVPVSLAPPPATPVTDEQPSSSTSALPESPDPALVEAVVQRILDKMRPQVVEIITKEFLRPIVQALVHREILKR
jgi:CheY-like chemotaxis protein